MGSPQSLEEPQLRLRRLAREDTKITEKGDNWGSGLGELRSRWTAEGLQNDNSDKSSQEPKATVSSIKSTTAPKFNIDPITMRKVHKTSTILKSDQGATIIPVKTFPDRGAERSQPKSSSDLKTVPKPAIASSSVGSHRGCRVKITRRTIWKPLPDRRAFLMILQPHRTKNTLHPILKRLERASRLPVRRGLLMEGLVPQRIEG